MNQGVLKRAVTILLFAAAAPVLADQPVSEGGPVPFEFFDSDASGYVSPNEFARIHAERVGARTGEQRRFRYMGDAPAFPAIDTDSDDRLSRNEFQAHQRERQAQRHQLRLENRQRHHTGGPAGNGPGRGSGSGGRK